MKNYMNNNGYSVFTVNNISNKYNRGRYNYNNNRKNNFYNPDIINLNVINYYNDNNNLSVIDYNTNKRYNMQKYNKYNNNRYNSSREKYIQNQYNKYSKKNIIRSNNKNINRSMSPVDRRKLKYVNDPFKVANKHKTNFGYVYSVGGIPCRLDFNSNMTIKWDIEPKDLDYDPTLEICFEGLLETEHPYCFISRECIKQMLMAENAYEKVLPLLPKLLKHCRRALDDNNPVIFLSAMDVVRMLSFLVKDKMNKYLYLVLLPINKRSFRMKYKEKVFDLLRDLEENGGEDAYFMIKNKIPTYMTAV